MKAIIVDDEKHVREGLLLLGDWSRFGVNEIYEATDGEEAKRLIDAHRPDLVFTDMEMPKCNGIALLQWLHERNIDARTIVVSGYDDFEYMRHAILYGSFDYILKPIHPAALNEALERAVMGRGGGRTEPSDNGGGQLRTEKNGMLEIEAYLRANFKEDVTLQDISERFYLSREYISRRFKQDFGATITEFVTNLRIQQAKELLGRHGLKIYEIAEAVGYRNDKYFIKVFKNAEGITPSEYRSRLFANRGSSV